MNKNHGFAVPQPAVQRNGEVTVSLIGRHVGVNGILLPDDEHDEHDTPSSLTEIP